MRQTKQGEPLRITHVRFGPMAGNRELFVVEIQSPVHGRWMPVDECSSMEEAELHARTWEEGL